MTSCSRDTLNSVYSLSGPYNAELAWVVVDNVATPLWRLTNKAHSSVWKEFE